MLKVFGRLCDEGCSVLVSGREILLVVAVFCFAWQRRMSLGQGGVESDGGEVPSSQTEVKSRWGREKRKLESESGCTLMIKKAKV